MPSYSNSPFNPVSMLLLGDVGYSFGSLDFDQAATRMAITSVAVASNVATLGVQILEGEIPSAGSLISVQGTSTNFGIANVTNVALTSVSINASTGVGTVVFPLIGSNVSTTADSGMALVPVPEIYETVVNGTKGQQWALPLVAPPPNSGDSIAWSYFFLSGNQPGTSSVQLQGAQMDIDSQYSVIDSGTSTSGETRVASLAGIKPKFLRIVMASLTGGSGIGSPPGYKALGKIGS